MLKKLHIMGAMKKVLELFKLIPFFSKDPGKSEKCKYELFKYYTELKRFVMIYNIFKD